MSLRRKFQKKKNDHDFERQLVKEQKSWISLSRVIIKTFDELILEQQP